MPNQFGTLATATIIQEALDLVFTVRPVLNNISLGFTDRNGSPIAQFNQPVITRTLGIPTVQNAGAAASSAADTDVSVTLNQYKQLAYTFLPTEYSATNRDLVRERAMPIAVAFANFMVDQVASLVTPANFPVRTGADAVANNVTNNITKVGAGWDYTHLVNQRAIINKAGVPMYKRFYAANSDIYASMLNDQRIVAALYNQNNAEAIKRGELPNVAGFDIEEYPGLPANGANLIGFCGAPDALVYAQRVPRDPREVIPGLPIPGNVGVVTNPRNGLSVQLVEYVDLSTLNVTTKILWMYGVAPGNTNNLQMIASQ